jgi:hypothetical protein
MLFDDYSYEMYNKHVLINPNVEEDDKLEDEEIGEDESEVE